MASSFKEFRKQIKEDNVANGAAALAYYMMLSIFPGVIFLFSLLPYLPIPELRQAMLDFINQTLPGDAASMITGVINDVMGQRRGGLLSLGLILALWSASNGMRAAIQQLNVAYDVEETRPFWKQRGIAILLTVIFVALILLAFALIVLGGQLQGILASQLGWSDLLRFGFAALRWIILGVLVLLVFAIIYYMGPAIKQVFRWVSPGSVAATILLAVATFGFALYVNNFGKYSATYGSLGAVIIFMLWLYLTGWVLLLGAEINSIISSRKAADASAGNGNSDNDKGKPHQE